MKRKRTKLKERLPYINRFLLGESVVELGQEISLNKLTGIKEYDCCPNKIGTLAIYQWKSQYFKVDHFSWRLKNIQKWNDNYFMNNDTKKLKEEIEKLKRENKKLQKINNEMNDVIKIQIGILEDNLEKSIDIEELRKQKKKKQCSISINKLICYMQLSKGAVYYKQKQKSLIREGEKVLAEIILFVHEMNRCVLGRMKLLIKVNKELKKRKMQPTSECVLRRLCKALNIKSCIIRKQKRKDPKNTRFKCKDEIKRRWNPGYPRRNLFSDVTYFALANGITLYISVIIDGFSHRVLAWNISLKNDTNLIIGMLAKIKFDISNCVIHTDHGSVYSSHEYIKLISSLNCVRSMSRVGNSLDNQPIEKHFSFLKMECLKLRGCDKMSFKQIVKELREYYNWFNNERPIGSKNYLTPKQIEYNYYQKSGSTFLS